MSQEIENVYGINPAELPDISRAPFKDIEQTYLTPYPADPRYPEVATGEWRVRKTITPNAELRYTTAVKFGSKASGTRIEIETDLAPGDFGTSPEDIARYGQAVIRKRRYKLDNNIELDHFDEATHGALWLAEREFADETARNAWQPPAWCRPLDSAPSNRELAVPLPRSAVEQIDTSPLETIIPELERMHKLGRALLVTVSGMSGSGKSTLAREVTEKLAAAHIETDNFHIGVRALMIRGGRVNHDLPTTYNPARAARAITKLLSGQPATIPHYDFATAEPDPARSVLAEPPSSRVLVIEGLYAAQVSKLVDRRSLGTIRTFDILLSTPLYVCVLRRLMRDALGSVPERVTTMDGETSLRYLMSTAIPTYRRHQLSAREFDAVV